MKKNKLPSVIILLILTFLTIVFWISFDVYRAIKKEPSPTVTVEVLNPIVPSLDASVIEQIQKRN